MRISLVGDLGYSRLAKIPDFFFRFVQLISLFNQEVGDLDYSRLGKIPDFFFRFVQLISLFK
ncbi:MAG: hypothetical protein F6K47_02235 [Symploca sp. SIO2E6]|nr:hypothetical protein [Symploca sp. SIO2E6]